MSESDVEAPRAIPRKDADLGDWFRSTLEFGGFVDYNYPLQGCGVWRGYGWALRNHFVEVMRKLLAASGHEEMYFPFLIPESLIMKEGDFIKGFAPDVYWVTQGGASSLSERLAIRPTSETAIYPMFKRWIRTKNDLPLKTWQIVSVFRYETKTTRPMTRVREITTFKEAHTAHATYEDAEQQIRQAVAIYKLFFDALGVPYFVSRRPKFDTFPGADYTLAFDTILPDGKVYQVGTVHNLGYHFSEAFDIQYSEPDGSKKRVVQTCYGVSERAIAAMLYLHGDDHGFVLPPIVAPVQIVIVPIGDDQDPAVLEYAHTVKTALSPFWRVELDLRSKRPAWKFYDWELKGVPLRVEVGPKETRASKVTAVRRDTFKRASLELSDLQDGVRGLLEALTDDMRARAWKINLDRFAETGAFFQLDGPDAVEKMAAEDDIKASIVRVPFCGDEGCLKTMWKYVPILGSANALGDGGPSIHGNCCCGKPGIECVQVGRLA